MARRPFVEDGAHSLPVEPETESIFFRKLSDLCFALRLVLRPEAFQLMLVNSAVLPFANLQLAFDLTRELLHVPAPQLFRMNDFGQKRARLSIQS